MSLHVLADHMASKGRNGDSMLVHMTPGEVAGLHALALKHGGELTINPDTGLPEANFLKSLLPMLAGAALNFFVPGLGAAVGGAFGLGAAAGTGIAVGGLTTLATGSLSRGLMAGLGAYGGAGLTEGLMGAGGNQLVAGGAPIGAENIAGTAVPPIEQVNPSNFNLSNADKLGAGFKALGTEAGRDAVLTSMGGGANALKYAGAAALPIAADMMVPTTTKMPEAQNPGYIRQKVFDPGSQTYRSLTPIKANEFKDRSFSDIYRGYNDGGIVALAIGGDTKTALEAAYAANDVAKINEIASANKITAGDISDTYKGFDTSGIQGLQLYTPPAAPTTSGITDLASAPTTNTAATTPYYFQQNKDVADAYAQNSYGMTPEAFAQAHFDKYGKTEGREFAPSAAANYAAANNQNLVTNTNQWLIDHPFATPDQISAAVTGSGMSKQDVTRSLDSLVDSGKISAAERYYIEQGKGLSGMAENSAKWLKDNAGATQTQIDAVLKAASMNTSDAQQVLSHGFQVADNQMAAAAKYIQDNPDVARWITSAQGQAYIKEHPEFDAKDIAFTHYERYGKKEGRKWGADQTKTTGTGGTGINNVNALTGGSTLSSSTLYPNGAVGTYGNNTGNPLTSTPGDIISNTDGTVSIVPNIPGRPYGGFPGMGAVKNAYTAGGGSLGYTPYAPKTADEHDELYNRFTPGGDSEAAYNYLMGKGGAKYPTKSKVGQIATPYRESVMGYPASTNKAYNYDAASGKMVRNPEYVAPMRDSSGNVTYGMSLNEIKSTLAKAPLSGQALYDWATTNNVDAQEIADATGRKLSDIYAEFRDAAKKAADKKKVGVVPDSDMNVNLANGGMSYSVGGGLGSLGSYSDGGRLLKGPGDGVSDSIPATIGQKQQPARLADGEFVVPARIVSELGNGSTDAGAKKLYAMMDRVQRARGKTTGKNKVAANSRAEKYLPA